jgi:membrane associated rhomboid family serine protease
MAAPPRYQPQGPTWIGARPTAGATGLLVAETAVFLVYAFLNQPGWIVQHLALTPVRALGREPWQLITVGLVHLHGLRLISSLIGIWVFATAVEQRSSRLRMLVIFGAAQVAGALAIAGVGRLLAPQAHFDGCSPGVFGLMAAFGVLYGPVPLRFFGLLEMRGRTMALLVIGLSLLTSLLNQDFVSVAGDVAGLLVGWAVTARAGSQLGAAWGRMRLWRMRRRYKVISGGRDTKRYLN